MARDFVVTARVNEYFEVTIDRWEDDISDDGETHKFILESEARKFIGENRRLRVRSFVKITDMLANEND
jgi:hypothetical protein